MEAIGTYIENVFKAFPQNERVAALKRDMLAGMEEKYNALKSEGKSEHEAVGSVIADFGNIDEIAAELGVNTDISAAPSAPAEADSRIPVSREEAFSFLKQMRKSSFWIGIGVLLIMTGISAMLIIGNFDVMRLGGNSGGVKFGTEGGIGLFVLFVAIAAAVPFFITHGITISRYFSKFGGADGYGINVKLDKATVSELERERERFMPKFIGLIGGGVAVVLLAVGGFVLLTSARLDVLPLAALMFIIGFAALIFIIAGMEFSVYEMLLSDNQIFPKKGAKKAERIIGTVASVFWPLTTAVYLLWSFVGEDWGISWIIWPIAGVLFGAFAGGISTWNEGRDK